jgi:hypothetical protein
MGTEKTSYADVLLDLLSIQHHSLNAGHDYDRYLHDAEDAGLQEVAYFIRLIMQEDAARAAHCQSLIRRFSCADVLGPTV